MITSGKLLKNKDSIPIMIGILLIGYLYLDTPLPFNLKLGNISLLITILFAVCITYFLFVNVNIFVAIIFVLVTYEILRKSANVNKKNIDKKVKFYNSPPNSSSIISDKLKESNTLEQEMVSQMVPPVTKNTLLPTPRYQATLPTFTGASLLE